MSLPLDFHMGRCEPAVQHMIVVSKHVKLRPLLYYKTNSVHMQVTYTRLYTQLLRTCNPVWALYCCKGSTRLWIRSSLYNGEGLEGYCVFHVILILLTRTGKKYAQRTKLAALKAIHCFYRHVPYMWHTGSCIT